MKNLTGQQMSDLLDQVNEKYSNCETRIKQIAYSNLLEDELLKINNLNTDDYLFKPSEFRNQTDLIAKNIID
jgi:hypothetical protein